MRAVAAEESREYAKKSMSSADASAELAKRMERVGNFNKLEREGADLLCELGDQACVGQA